MTLKQHKLTDAMIDEIQEAAMSATEMYVSNKMVREVINTYLAMHQASIPTEATGDDVERDGFVPCPTCKQYSHSIGEDKLTEAFRHFQSMIAHPVRGHPMGDAFDEQTRDAAQVLMAALEQSQKRERELVAIAEAVKERCFAANGDANWQHDILSIVVPVLDVRKSIDRASNDQGGSKRVAALSNTGGHQ